VTADAVSANTVDLAVAGRDIGIGEPMTVAIQVSVAADSTTGDETYAFEFIQSANANLSSADVLVARTIAAASLTAGSVHYLDIPGGMITKRYVGLNYNVGGTTPTITVSAWIEPKNMTQITKVYAKGYTIS
jgi:hypothetical protein